MARRENQPLRRLILGLLLLLTGVGALILLLRFLRRRQRKALRPAPAPVLAPDLDQIPGLSEEEAAARMTWDPELERQEQHKLDRRAVLRRNSLSIFNVTLLGLAIANLALDDPLGALITIGVLILNIGVNVFQQLLAARRVEELVNLTKPRATVVRAGNVKSLDIDEVVVGDMLLVGTGDEILTDGVIHFSSEDLRISTAGAISQRAISSEAPGDTIHTGSICLKGWAAYEALERPSNWGAEGASGRGNDGTVELTPLQVIIDRILRFLLAAVAIFLVLFIIEVSGQPVVPDELQQVYRDIASIIFNLAPAGLFFMIVVSYAMGSADLTKTGALVRNSLAIESLAQATVLCFGKTGTLTGREVQITGFNGAAESALSDSRIRQILGDWAQSTTSNSPYIRIMKDSFEGERRPVQEESRHFAAYGWSGITFDTLDLTGTYVMGLPEVLEPALEAPQEEDGAGEEQGESAVRRTFGRLRGLFQREGDQQDSQADESSALGQVNPPANEVADSPPGSAANQGTEEDEADQEEETAGPSRGRRFFNRLSAGAGRLLRRNQEDAEAEASQEDPTAAEMLLTLSYSPEPQSLFDSHLHPQLPQDLIPLGSLRVVEQIRSEAREAVQAFTQAGVRVKILSADQPQTVIQAGRQIGLEKEDGEPLQAISGAELASMGDAQQLKTVLEKEIFAPVSAEEKGLVIGLLRASGEKVAMVGDTINDVAAIRRANLKISMQSSTQAVLGRADIVLLEESLKALPAVMQGGQRIVNGLLDVLKLNLSQVGYILFLLMAFFILDGQLFFYTGAQGGVIAFFTLVVPAIGLTFWASQKSVPERSLWPQLAHFVIPAALTIALAILLVAFRYSQSGSPASYVQLIVTYLIVAMGLLITLFAQPPSRFWVGGDELSGDRRISAMVAVLIILFLIATFIPLAQDLLEIGPLESSQDYLFVAAAALVWALVTRTIWRTAWLRRLTGTIDHDFYPEVHQEKAAIAKEEPG